MIQRLLLVVLLLLLLSLAMQSCGPSSYVSMYVRPVDGTPHLVLESFSSTADGPDVTFGIYRARSPDLDDWAEVTPPRNGHAYGVFVLKPPLTPPGEERPKAPAAVGERLGIFHKDRATVFDFTGKEATQTYELLPFSWYAETAVYIKNDLYAFGVKLPKEIGKGREGPLKVARYDGAKWHELAFDGPKVHIGEWGFLLHAIEFQGGARVFWREAQPDQAIAPEVEGPRATTAGPLMMATFDGERFVGDPVAIDNLPRGSVTAWADGDQIRVLVQVRPKLEDFLASNGPMEVWKVSPDGKADFVEEIEKSRVRSGLQPFIAAEHVMYQGQEFIIRSNWQFFEIWRKTPEAGWVRQTAAPRGLPLHDLEMVLLGALGMCLALIAFGAGLAYHRRRQALAVMRQIQAREIYATLGLRMGAYAVDLGLCLAGGYYIGRLLGWTSISSLFLVPTDLVRSPHWPFFGLYMTYLTVGECVFGSTIGKFLMGLAVVDEMGERPTLWAALVRNLIGFFERLPHTFVFVAVPMIIFGPRRQRLGDILAHTFVVQKAALDMFKTQRARAAARQQQPAVPGALMPRMDVNLWDADEKKNGGRPGGGSQDDQERKP
jgi:uncharacterized RDD family membrane protein YckC